MRASVQQEIEPAAVPRQEPRDINGSLGNGDATSKFFDVERSQGALDLSTLLRGAAKETGRLPHQIMGEFAKLSFGPGRLSLEEYFSLRLYDDKQLSGVDKKAFVGVRAMRKIWNTANYCQTWLGLIDDKLAFNTLMAGFGFPVTKTFAYYHPSRSLPGIPVLRNRQDIGGFLRSEDHFPLFCKPDNSYQSLGAASFDRFDGTCGQLRSASGGHVRPDDFASEIERHFTSGYLFQERLSPHADLQPVFGDRLATVRIYTICDRDGPEILNAVWKIPGSSNVADNFWRSGNLLAQLAMADGRVLRVVTGTGPGQRQLVEHPDTGAKLVDVHVPDWKQILDMTRDAANAMSDTPLLGWDIAPTERGGVIIEANADPDFMLWQIAEREGVLSPRFKAFLASSRSACETFKKDVKARLLEENAANLRKVMVGVSGATS